VTPPSTLRLGGIAATLVALVLMGADRPDPGRARHEPDQVQFAYAFAELAEAQAALTAAHKIEHGVAHKLAYAKGIAVGYDSVTTVLRVSPAPVISAAVRR
jgi:alcohol dehydrogenase class IV